MFLPEEPTIDILKHLDHQASINPGFIIAQALRLIHHQALLHHTICIFPVLTTSPTARQGLGTIPPSYA